MPVSRLQLRLFLNGVWKEAQGLNTPFLTHLKNLTKEAFDRVKSGEIVSSTSAAGHSVAFHFSSGLLNPVEVAEALQTLEELATALLANNPGLNEAQLIAEMNLRLVPMSRFQYNFGATVRT